MLEPGNVRLKPLKCHDIGGQISLGGPRSWDRMRDNSDTLAHSGSRVCARRKFKKKASKALIDNR